MLFFIFIWLTTTEKLVVDAGSTFTYTCTSNIGYPERTLAYLYCNWLRLPLQLYKYTTTIAVSGLQAQICRCSSVLCIGAFRLHLIGYCYIQSKRYSK